MKCLVLILENSFFDTKQTLYYLIGIKVSPSPAFACDLCFSFIAVSRQTGNEGSHQ